MIQRQEAFKSISDVLALMQLKLRHHQSINDYSLNMYGENFFRDVFNHVYAMNFTNTNFGTRNAASIDLIDKGNKQAIQVTTNTTVEKIRNTLKYLKKENCSDYTVKIFYLLEKPNLQARSKGEIGSEYSVKIDDIILDYSDLLRDINNLETGALLELDRKYFKNPKENYTNNIVLNLVIHHLRSEYANISPNYNEYFPALPVDEKIVVNNLNRKIEGEIRKGLDYQGLLLKLDNRGETIEDLRKIVVEDIYRPILKSRLRTLPSSDITGKNTLELSSMAEIHDVNFNSIFNELYNNLANHCIIRDFNSMNIMWVIISHFFEICYIGKKVSNDPSE